MKFEGVISLSKNSLNHTGFKEKTLLISVNTNWSKLRSQNLDLKRGFDLLFQVELIYQTTDNYTYIEVTRSFPQKNLTNSPTEIFLHILLRGWKGHWEIF